MVSDDIYIKKKIELWESAGWLKWRPPDGHLQCLTDAILMEIKKAREEGWNLCQVEAVKYIKNSLEFNCYMTSKGIERLKSGSEKKEVNEDE